MIKLTNNYQVVEDMSYSSFAQLITFRVSLNLAYAELQPRTTTNPYYPLSKVNKVARHPPALLVIPVFMPTTSPLSSSLFVLFQMIGLHSTFPYLKNLKVPL